MNFLAMGYASIFAEALALGQKVGLNPPVIDSALRGSRMDSGFYQTFFRWVLERDREAHKFTVSNAHKDMKYLASMAEAAGIANPVGSAVKNYFALAQAAGRGDDFVPMLADFVAALNGVTLDPANKARSR
jgi:3-hydroxyisobutyrate dehydrogenase-like beta-hydroxyacid dehydrogenase